MTEDKSSMLFQALIEKGMSEELSHEIAYKQLITDYTATRMLGYLYRYESPRQEDIVDEMIAILSDRANLVKKHESEAAQAKINELYEKGLENNE